MLGDGVRVGAARDLTEYPADQRRMLKSESAPRAHSPCRQTPSSKPPMSRSAAWVHTRGPTYAFATYTSVELCAAASTAAGRP
jgi:hypothetical protein